MTEIKDDDYLVLYVIVRDLDSMTPGKMAAHSGHAANAFIHENYISKVTSGHTVHNDVIRWASSTSQGFGTQINLKAPWYQAHETMREVREHNKLIAANYVIDPTYPYEVTSEILRLINPEFHTAEATLLGNGNYRCFRKEITAMYFFGLKSTLSPFLGQYPLQP